MLVADKLLQISLATNPTVAKGCDAKPLTVMEPAEHLIDLSQIHHSLRSDPEIVRMIDGLVRLTQNPAEVRRTCVHEVGHVVMARLLGGKVREFSGPAVVYNQHRKRGDKNFYTSHGSAVRCSAPGSGAEYERGQALINVAGFAAEYVTLNEDRHVYFWGQSGDAHNFVQGMKVLYPERASETFFGDYERTWAEAVQRFRTDEAKEMIAEEAENFRTFLTTDVTPVIDISAVDETRRKGLNLAALGYKIKNALVGPPAENGGLPAYMAAQLTAFQRIGVEAIFHGPSVKFKAGKRKDYLKESLGEVVATDPKWIERFVKKAADRDAALLDVATVLAAGIAVDKGCDWLTHYGESEYVIRGRIVRLYAKYVPTFGVKLKAAKKKQSVAQKKYWALSKEQRKKSKFPYAGHGVYEMESALVNEILAKVRRRMNSPVAKNRIREQAAAIRESLLPATARAA